MGIISSILKPKLNEKNVMKHIHQFQYWFFDRSSHFAKEYVGIQMLQKRDDLRKSFFEILEKEMKEIITSNNPHYFFRKKIIKTIKTQVVYEVLLGKKFDESRDKICNAINRGMKSLPEHWDSSKVSFDQVLFLIKDAEAFYGVEWGYEKIAHEYAWAEAEGLALRHMQALLFCEKVDYKDDWWNLYKKYCEIYFEKFYDIVASSEDKLNGFPHPLLFQMDDLLRVEETILKAVEHVEV